MISKRFLLIAACFAVACSTHSFAADDPNANYRIQATLAADPLTDELASTYEFDVIYESSEAIDITTLDDDDILVGTQMGISFRRSPGQLPQRARFLKAEPADMGKKVRASYALDRPKEGWISWNIPRLNVQVLPESVRDIGDGMSGPILAGMAPYSGLHLDFDELPDLTISRLSNAISVRDGAAYAEFEIVYSANYPLDADLFAQGEMRVHRQQLRTVNADDLPQEVALPTGESLRVEAGNIDISPDATTLTLTYRIPRPNEGWVQEGLDLVIIAEPFALGENAKGYYTAGSPVLGYLHPISDQEPQAMVSADESDEVDPPSYEFDVTYEHPSGIDISTLGDDDWSTLPVSSSLYALFSDDRGNDLSVNFLAADTNNEGTTTKATYSIERPTSGWNFQAQRAFLYLSLRENSVYSNDGQSADAALLGVVVISADLGFSTLPQVVGFDFWVNELADALGLETNISPESDTDGDGTNDLVELTLGTGIDDPTEVHGLVPSIVKIDNERHFHLSLAEPTLIGTTAILEGSSDGILWEDAIGLFAPSSVSLGNQIPGNKQVALQSVMSLKNLPYQYFRIRVAPIR